MTTLATTTEAPDTSVPSEVDVAIIGSGFAGLGMAIRLKQAGIDDFVVLERADDVGGTWRDNTYPGCACDVQSHLYSFSFAPNPDWTRTYSPQPEIQAYLQRTAERFDVRAHVRFGADVDRRRLGRGRRSAGGSRRRRATLTRRSVLVSAAGAAGRPADPGHPGPRHASPARRSTPPAGTTTTTSPASGSPSSAPARRRSSSSRRSSRGRAAARLPAHAAVDRAAHRPRRSSRASAALYRALPGRCSGWSAAGVYAAASCSSSASPSSRGCMKLVEKLARRHLRQPGRRPRAARASSTPDYTIGCKRILLSQRLLPGARARRTSSSSPTASPRSARTRSSTADGAERRLDTIIFGTGFHVTDLPIAAADPRPRRAHARRGWDGSPRALPAARRSPASRTCSCCSGPNTGLGHTSMVYMIESQVAYVIDALRAMAAAASRTVELKRRGAGGLTTRVDAQHGGHGLEHRRLRELVPRRHGHNTTLWPDFTFRFRRRARASTCPRTSSAPGAAPTWPRSRQIVTFGTPPLPYPAAVQDARTWAGRRPLLRRRSRGSSGRARRARGPRGGCRGRPARPPRSRCP